MQRITIQGIQRIKVLVFVWVVLLNQKQMEEIISSKEGFRQKKHSKEENSRLITQDETRVWCKAMLYLKKNQDK